MTTLTAYIPDNEMEAIAEIIKKRGRTVLVNSKDRLSKKEQISLNKSLEEAQQIKAGETKALDFDDLWNE